MKVIQEIIIKTLNNKQRFELEIPYFNRSNGEKTFVKTISVGNNDLVIFEGVPALAISKNILDKINLKIYIKCNESKRIEDVKKDYILRGKDNEIIEQIIEQRNIDENEIIRNTCRFASFIYERQE
jgi:uridine kinase